MNVPPDVFYLRAESISSSQEGGGLDIIRSLKHRMGPFGEWLSIFIPIAVLFGYVHTENVRLCDRLDTHMESINRRVDQQNSRSDDLHREFYALLKEVLSLK